MLKNRRGHQAADPADAHSAAEVRADPPAGPPAGAPGAPAGATASTTDDAPAPAGRRWPAWFRMFPEIGALIFCAVLYSRTGAWDTTVEGPGPAFYPQLLIWLLALAMLVRLGQHVLEIRRERAGAQRHVEAAVEEGVEFDESAISTFRVWQAIAMSVGYVFATLYLGWVIATFVFVVAFLYMCGKRNLLITVPLGAGLAVGFAYIFVKVVYIALPTGVGVFDLITLRLFQAIGAY